MEFEGKNVAEAVHRACEQLEIPEENLKYEIVSHGSTGIFGLVGSKKAKIKIQDTPLETLRTKVESETLLERAESPVYEPPPVNDEASYGNVVQIGEGVIRQITDAITTDADVSVEETNGRVVFQIKGGNAALLIGKRGQTLEAIQYIVEKIINKQCSDRVRVQVDVEGYLENRRMNLEELAMRMAEKTKKTGKPCTIGQMNAHDRRIVHMALKHDKMVRTQSKGDGFLKKLVIFPKKANHRKNRND